jgi:hypothetical protein
MTPENLLCKIAKILEKLKIPYVVTGGFAVSVWGRPRYTADIDIVIELLPKNISPLAKNLLAIDKDVYVNERTMKEAFVRKGEFNFIHPQTGLKIDFWISKNGFEKQKINRGICKKIKNQKVNFISPEDLILSKLIWFKESKSTRHLEDIESILRISKVDLKYITKLAKKQSTLDILKKVMGKIANQK